MQKNRDYFLDDDQSNAPSVLDKLNRHISSMVHPRQKLLADIAHILSQDNSYGAGYFEHLSDVLKKGLPPKHVMSLDFPGTPRFNTDSIFRGDCFNFRDLFGNMEVGVSSPCTLSFDRLREPSFDADIIKEIGEAYCELPLGVIVWHIFTSQKMEKGDIYFGLFSGKTNELHWVQWELVDGHPDYSATLISPFTQRNSTRFVVVSRKPIAA